MSAGVLLYGVALYIDTLHPDILGRRFLWRVGEKTRVTDAAIEVVNEITYRTSPLAAVKLTGGTIRRRIGDPQSPMDFPILHDLQKEGVTDYVAMPLRFLDGQIRVITWTTQQPGGFSQSEIDAFEGILAPIARVAEIYALHWTAVNLLSTYLGRTTGERILGGQIRRGQTESIHAAIWLSDLRGFTHLADVVPGDRLVALLNDYFECQVVPIMAEGGEVLKYMGDGLLAIFPVRPQRREAEVCERALAACGAARRNIAALNVRRESQAELTLKYGMALHVGEVLYGNVGAPQRLDFTTIGPAVNLASRLEGLCDQMNRSVLVSAAFAAQCPGDVRRLGQVAVRGIAELQDIFGLTDDDGGRSDRR
ncbi:MAG: adenylate/guanylate cyclase domain-containing protein [Rhodospirillaceae bacterium]|nr:adenylate/guanylate cyclase domain-containing protein [Rhodospirillaceae bacterium]